MFLRRHRRPTPEEATERLLVLRQVLFYALAVPPRELLSSLAANWTDAEKRKFAQDAEIHRARYKDQLRRSGLSRGLSPQEKTLLRRTIVTMSHQQQVDATWRVEAAQTLMWALTLLPELPPHGELAVPEILKPDLDPTEFIRAASLRAQTEIDRARDIAELWHWRSRTRQLIEEGRLFSSDDKVKAAGIYSYDDLVQIAAQKAHQDGSVGPLVNADFPVKGKAYRDLTTEEWTEVTSTTRERHFALNWLCGRAPRNRWDKTPTDT
jgi:hypothetical protein